jgi:SAM-dependent methyltransferase
MTAEQILALPFGSPAGYDRIYWSVRRQSLAVLKQALVPLSTAPESSVVADIGAGLGWLAFRLAGLGFRAIALDASVDQDFGLGGARAYAERSAGRMFLVRGDLERLPIQRESLDIAVFNASLHYAEDVSRAIVRAAAALKPKGSLIVLDTPISRTPVPGRRLGGRHIGRRELEEAIRSAGLRPGWVPVRRGPRWWLHQALTRLRRKPTFSLPMLVASRP